MLASGLLVLAQPSQAQQPPPACPPQQDLPRLTKTANPDPATVGQPLTFTITETNDSPCPGFAIIEDNLPAGVTFVSVTTDFGECAQSDGEVGCILIIPPRSSATVEIVVIPTTPGTITNTAFDIFGNIARATVTVNPVPPPPPPPPIPEAAPPPVCTPVAQGIGIGEAQSADAEPETDVSNAGDNTNLTAASLQQSNTGNVQNAQGVNQCAVGESGDIELSGSSLEMSPALETASEQAIEQAAAS